jgi:hypothetical protein
LAADSTSEILCTNRLLFVDIRLAVFVDGDERQFFVSRRHHPYVPITELVSFSATEW